MVARYHCLSSVNLATHPCPIDIVLIEAIGRYVLTAATDSSTSSNKCAKELEKG